MNAYIAPTDQIDVRVLEAGLHAFYAELFTSLDITRAIDAMRVAAPTFNYLFSTAYGIFRTVFAEVIRDYGMGEGLLDSVAKVLKDGEPEAFNLFYRTYFATDLFPENAARFPLAYVEVKADAEAMVAAKSIAKAR